LSECSHSLPRSRTSSPSRRIAPISGRSSARGPTTSSRRVTWGRIDLDAEVPDDHEVRAIAAVIDKLDLRGLHADVRARRRDRRRTSHRPKILLGLWVYATRISPGFAP